MTPQAKGVSSALGAFLLWGLLPIYWKTLQHVPAIEILAHRVVWSAVFLAMVITLRKEWSGIHRSWSIPRVRWQSVTAALLLAVNWGTYIWGVNANRIVETSLGYYINPLVTVLLGVIVMRERLRRLQWLAVGVAGIGVGFITYRHGSVPWVALILAFTFAFYGLVKKTSASNPLPALTMETLCLGLPTMLLIGAWTVNGSGALFHAPATTQGLLVLSGLVTTMPLLLFGFAAKSVSLSTLGILQYLSPTCGLLLGVFLYGEPFGTDQGIGFVLIWFALSIYSIDGWRNRARGVRGSVVSRGTNAS